MTKAYYPRGLTKDLQLIMDPAFRKGFMYAIHLAETWCDLESRDPMYGTSDELDRTEDLIIFLKELAKET